MINARSWIRTSMLLVLLAAAPGCGGGGDGDGGEEVSNGPRLQDVIDPEPAAGNAVIPLFRKPFDGDYPLLNYFDHDRPVAPDDTNGYQLNWRGARAYPGRDLPGYDGHRGVDWLLPANTPVLAVTGGEIAFAGNIVFPCWLEDNRELENPSVILRFIAPDGQSYFVLYQHLNRVDVATGDIVTEGQQLGLSGATGCVGRSRTPHLHFQLERITGPGRGQSERIDPYGWEGPTPDPWSVNQPDRTSIWFWKQGQAPDLAIRR
jgi:murein DD-endopeptidase MepM/ murein hydrolase activator NlpD